MASGSNNDPPPLPPPNYKPQSTQEFLKKTQPLRGIIGDAADLPSESEARKVFSKEETERRRKEQEAAGLAPPTRTRRPSIPGPISRQPLVRPDRDDADTSAGKAPFNPKRSSGTSQLLNTAPPSTGEIVNTMPGGTFHTAGGEKPRELSVREAMSDFKPSDLLKVHQIPCVREALLQGMAAGTAVGAGRWIIGRAVWSCLNWAAGTFIGVSVVGHSYCQYQRGRERHGMKAAVKIMDEKQEEKRKAFAERKEAIMKKREESAQKKEEEEQKNNRRLGSILKWWENKEKEEGDERLRSAWRWWEGSGEEGGQKGEDRKREG